MDEEGEAESLSASKNEIESPPFSYPEEDQIFISIVVRDGICDNDDEESDATPTTSQHYVGTRKRHLLWGLHHGPKSECKPGVVWRTPWASPCPPTLSKNDDQPNKQKQDDDHVAVQVEKLPATAEMPKINEEKLVHPRRGKRRKRASAPCNSAAASVSSESSYHSRMLIQATRKRRSKSPRNLRGSKKIRQSQAESPRKCNDTNSELDHDSELNLDKKPSSQDKLAATTEQERRLTAITMLQTYVAACCHEIILDKSSITEANKLHVYIMCAPHLFEQFEILQKLWKDAFESLCHVIALTPEHFLWSSIEQDHLNSENQLQFGLSLEQLASIRGAGVQVGYPALAFDVGPKEMFYACADEAGIIVGGGSSPGVHLRLAPYLQECGHGTSNSSHILHEKQGNCSRENYNRKPLTPRYIEQIIELMVEEAETPHHPPLSVFSTEKTECILSGMLGELSSACRRIVSSWCDMVGRPPLNKKTKRLSESHAVATSTTSVGTTSDTDGATLSGNESVTSNAVGTIGSSFAATNELSGRPLSGISCKNWGSSSSNDERKVLISGSDGNLVAQLLRKNQQLIESPTLTSGESRSRSSVRYKVIFNQHLIQYGIAAVVWRVAYCQRLKKGGKVLSDSKETQLVNEPESLADHATKEARTRECEPTSPERRRTRGRRYVFPTKCFDDNSADEKKDDDKDKTPKRRHTRGMSISPNSTKAYPTAEHLLQNEGIQRQMQLFQDSNEPSSPLSKIPVCLLLSSANARAKADQQKIFNENDEPSNEKFQMCKSHIYSKTAVSEVSLFPTTNQDFVSKDAATDVEILQTTKATQCSKCNIEATLTDQQASPILDVLSRLKKQLMGQRKPKESEIQQPVTETADAPCDANKAGQPDAICLVSRYEGVPFDKDQLYNRTATNPTERSDKESTDANLAKATYRRRGRPRGASNKLASPSGKGNSRTSRSTHRSKSRSLSSPATSKEDAASLQEPLNTIKVYQHAKQEESRNAQIVSGYGQGTNASSDVNLNASRNDELVGTDSYPSERVFRINQQHTEVPLLQEPKQLNLSEIPIVNEFSNRQLLTPRFGETHLAAGGSIEDGANTSVFNTVAAVQNLGSIIANLRAASHSGFTRIESELLSRAALSRALFSMRREEHQNTAFMRNVYYHRYLTGNMNANSQAMESHNSQTEIPEQERATNNSSFSVLNSSIQSDSEKDPEHAKSPTENFKISVEESPTDRKRRGRPKGSKNKSKKAGKGHSNSLTDNPGQDNKVVSVSEAADSSVSPFHDRSEDTPADVRHSSKHLKDSILSNESSPVVPSENKSMIDNDGKASRDPKGLLASPTSCKQMKSAKCKNSVECALLSEASCLDSQETTDQFGSNKPHKQDDGSAYSHHTYTDARSGMTSDYGKSITSKIQKRRGRPKGSKNKPKRKTGNMDIDSSENHNSMIQNHFPDAHSEPGMPNVHHQTTLSVEGGVVLKRETVEDQILDQRAESSPPPYESQPQFANPNSVETSVEDISSEKDEEGLETSVEAITDFNTSSKKDDGEGVETSVEKFTDLNTSSKEVDGEGQEAAKKVGVKVAKLFLVKKPGRRKPVERVFRGVIKSFVQTSENGETKTLYFVEYEDKDTEHVPENEIPKMIKLHRKVSRRL